MVGTLQMAMLVTALVGGAGNASPVGLDFKVTHDGVKPELRQTHYAVEQRRCSERSELQYFHCKGSCNEEPRCPAVVCG
jgi:hypothetical protein